MPAAEGSYLGLAKQSSFGTPNTTDNDFKYLLFRQGSVSVNNVNLPLDPEVGGGAINPRDVVKAAVNSGGMLDIIPRPETLGWFLLGVTGEVTSEANLGYVIKDVTTTGSFAASNSFVTCSGSTGGSAFTFNTPAELFLLLNGGSINSSGSVVVTGTSDGTTPATERFWADTGSSGSFAGVTGSVSFKTISEIWFSHAPSGSASITYNDGSYTHTFKLGSNQFDAPYFTLRYAPGDLWGEQFQDNRVSLLALNFRGANFVDGAVQFVGRTPSGSLATYWGAGSGANDYWNAVDLVDNGPPLLASTPDSAIEIPTGCSARVLAGSFVATSAIPLDEQFVVGNYEPEGVDIVSRSYRLQLNIKIADDDLYHKMQYDPGGGKSWIASVFREGDVNIRLASGEDATTVGPDGCCSVSRPYLLTIAADGETDDCGTGGNVSWIAQPIALRAQRQVVMQIDGNFHPSPGNDPITFTLVNRKASYA